MSKLKIIQVTTFFYPVIGGVETQVADLAESLIAKDYNVEIFTTDSGRNNSRITKSKENISGVNVTRIRTWFSFSQFHKFAPGFIRKLWSTNFDIVHVHGIRKPELYLALLVAKLKGKKIVVSTHNPFTTNNRSWKLKLLIAIHDLTFGILLMRFVDYYFLLTAEEIQILSKFGITKSKFVVIGNGLALEYYQKIEVNRGAFLKEINKENNWQGIVLGVGRLNKVKGYQYLQRAIKELPNTLFIIIGGVDGYKEELLNLYQNEKNVYLPGLYLPRKELIKFYANSDVFVLPSEHEPFGIVLLEAMAQGCAIIAAKSNGPMTILNNNTGILLEATDQLGWKQNIQKLLLNSDLLVNYRNKSLLRAADFNWDKVLDKYINIYLRLS